MPIIPGMLYQNPDLLFDTEPLARTRIRLFHNPQGQQDINKKLKSLQQTNLFLPEILPAPERFIVKRMFCVLLNPCGGIVPLNAEVTAWSKITLSLEISSRCFVSGPAWNFAHPIAVFNGMKAEPAIAGVLLDAWSKHASMPLDEQIDQQQPFCVVVDCEESFPLPAFSIVVILQGLHIRAVI